ncbi:hypothetical protein ONZ45_g15108 [Pleurotus djamor]|nr:hypothetical protein ONZ45_g15108 [Pleurotus djamor]
MPKSTREAKKEVSRREIKPKGNHHVREGTCLSPETSNPKPVDCTKKSDHTSLNRHTEIQLRSSFDTVTPERREHRQGHCQLAAKLIEGLEEKIECLPKNTPVAENTHPFAHFAGDLRRSVPSGEDAWEGWDPALNAVLCQQSAESMRDLVQVGEYGLTALCGLLWFLVYDQQVAGVLIKGKVGRLMEVIDDM